MSKLQSPNFRVSKTRLIVYNVPKTRNEKDQKKIFINAVISRATKQKPHTSTVKILKDSKVRKEGEKSHPRGAAFLEFTEHQHALVALRVLNNNPDIFDAEHRPIVEFALDNVQKLKLQAEKLQAQQQQGPPHDTRGNFGQNDHSSRASSFANSNPTIRKSRDGDASFRGLPVTKKGNGRTNLVKEWSVRKVATKGRKVLEEVLTAEFFSPEKKPKIQVLDKRKGREAGAAQETIPTNTVNKKEGRDAGMPRKKMPRNQFERSMEGDGSESIRKRMKRSDPVGRDVMDKLDRLIEQYRSKFTGSSSAQSGDKKQSSKNLERWFPT